MTFNLVRELRELTGAGILECKKALTESSGHLEGAVEYLRKQGLKAAIGKAMRVAADGLIATWVSPDHRTGVILEVNCETDFVAKNEDFKKFASDVAGLIALKSPENLDHLLDLPLASQEKVSEVTSRLVARIGEKIGIRRFVTLKAQKSELMGSYIHLGSKIGVLVTLKGNKADETMAKDVAMHVAASHPLYLKSADIPLAVLAKEKEIFLAQLNSSGKPQNVLEKILEGKMAKYATEVCLEDQIFIKDPTGKKSVGQFLRETDPTLAVASFVRYQVGEGIEKKKDDFATEVARMAK